jgi:hypothetical protein
MNNRLIIGIDPGLNTGVAVAEGGRIIELRTCGIAPAMFFVLGLHRDSMVDSILVMVEDARQRSYFGAVDKKMAKYGPGVREGAGAAKREASIWDEFLEARLIPHQMIPPIRGGTKLTAAKFLALTGCDHRSSVHSRDAGVIAWHYSKVDRGEP